MADEEYEALLRLKAEDQASDAINQVNSGLDKINKTAMGLSKTLAGTLAGGFIGAVTGPMLSEVGKLNTLMGQFTAQTGLSGDAATKARDAITSLYKTNIAGLDEIEQTMANVHNDLQLTGDAATAATQLFLDFSEATGVSAAGSVDTIHKALAAFNLDVDQAGPLMDQLTVSHQRFGINVSQSLSVLQRLGPAFDAVGMSISDGVGYLNMFQAAGVNSSVAAAGLRIALTKVHSPAELQNLIQQISDTTDAFQRSSEASQLFGSRAGPQLAQALSQGGLDKYLVSTQDAAGATQKAADAVENTWGAHFTLLMHQATGVVIDFGNNFGNYFGIISAVAQRLGPKLAATVGGALGGMAGNWAAKVITAITTTQTEVLLAAATVGTAEGVAETEAAGVAKKAAVPAQTALWGAEELAVGVPESAAVGTAEGEAQAAAQQAALVSKAPVMASAFSAALLPVLGVALTIGGAAVIASVVDGLAQSEEDARQASYKTAGLDAAEIAAEQYKNTMSSHDMGNRFSAKGAAPADYEARIKSAQAKLDAAQRDQVVADTPKMSEAAQEQVDAVAARISGDQALISQATKDGFVGVPTAVTAAWYEANFANGKGLADAVAAIKNSKSTLASTWSEAENAQTGAATIGLRERSALADIADTQKQLADKKTYAKLTEQQKDALKIQLINQQNAYTQLLLENAQYGTTAQKTAALGALLTSKAMTDGLSSSDPDTRTMWTAVYADTQTQMDKINGIMNTEGANAASAYRAAFMAGIASGTSTSAILSGMTVTVLPPKVNILSGPQTLPTSSILGPGKATGDPNIAQNMYSLLHQGEAVIPAAYNKTGLRDLWADGGSSGSGGDTVIHTHISLDGREIAEVVDHHQGIRYLLAGSTVQRPAGA